MADDPGTEQLSEIVHLSGSEDVTQYMGRVLGYTSRPVFPNCCLEKFTVRAGRLRWIPVGPMKHMGLGNYSAARPRLLSDGTPHVQKTAEVVIGLLTPRTGRTVRRVQCASGEAGARNPAELPAPVSSSLVAGRGA